MIDNAEADNKTRTFVMRSGEREVTFPYEWAEVVPRPDDPIVHLEIDAELASEAIAYRLRSGREGWVHWEQALEYNRDPEYLRRLQVYLLTEEAARRFEESRLAKREIARRLGTSPAQVCRLLDPANERKTLDSMFDLLTVLGVDVEVVTRTARTTAGRDATLIAQEGTD